MTRGMQNTVNKTDTTTIFTSRRTSSWAHWGWFLLLSLPSWMTEPVKESKKHEASDHLGQGKKKFEQLLVALVLTASERYVQGIALYTILVMPACWQRCASTSPTAWHAATQVVEASSLFTAHSLVEQESTGTRELLENTSAVTWCWERLNTSLRRCGDEMVKTEVRKTKMFCKLYIRNFNNIALTI